jgi:hypothetical protein
MSSAWVNCRSFAPPISPVATDGVLLCGVGVAPGGSVCLTGLAVGEAFPPVVAAAVGGAAAGSGWFGFFRAPGRST